MKLVGLFLCVWIYEVVADFLPVCVVTRDPSLTNLGPMGNATQSSLYDVTGLAKHAIDGNTNSNYHQLSCSHTRAEDDPWWRLDLLKPRTIISVVLTNRQDCCSRRLRGVHVRVGKSLRKKSNTNFECVHEHLVTSPGATVRFCCYGMTGRYVIVFIPNRRGFLSLCEVEVFGVLPCR
nr:PREDICTED: fucolectin-like [Latimeria chalumnae]|eukprot:XP_014349310.1 PREDICTED: fucolectin-like [Latimeria chalumnae]